MATLSEENYLKAIFHLAADDVVSVSTNAIARKMDTKASSATDMIQKLFEKGLIDYQKYKGELSISTRRLSRAAGSSKTSMRRLGMSIAIVSPGWTRPIAPPAAASGDTCPIESPDVPPEKRPSVTSAQALPRPFDFR